MENGTVGGCAANAEGCADDYCMTCWAKVCEALGWADKATTVQRLPE